MHITKEQVMKLKLDDVKISSFVTQEIDRYKGGWAPPTEAAGCTENCNPGSQFCYTVWCPSDRGECGYTDLC